jgi:hypothetical protein
MNRRSFLKSISAVCVAAMVPVKLVTIKQEPKKFKKIPKVWGSISGAPMGQHYDLLIYDDIISGKSIASSDKLLNMLNEKSPILDKLKWKEIK